MKLKSYTAANMNTAMEKIRQDLGDNAIIVNSSKVAGGVRVTAAVDNSKESFETINHKVSAPKFQNQLFDLFKFHKIPPVLMQKFIGLLEHNAPDIDTALQNIFAASFKFEPLKFSLPKPLMVIGMPGIGKTLAVSKMATEASFYSKKINVITTDIKRAGGVEQLTAFTKILGVELIVARNPKELKEALEPTTGQITIIDTAGANPYDQIELDGTKELLQVADVEPLLVIQAGGDVEEAADIAHAFKFANAKRMLITKADSARRLGSIFAAASTNNLAFCNFSGTPNVGKGLDPVTPKSLSSLVLRPIQ